MKFHIHGSPLIWLRFTTDDTSLLPCSCEGSRRPAAPTVISSLGFRLFMPYEKVNHSIKGDELIQFVPPKNLLPMCSWDQVM